MSPEITAYCANCGEEVDSRVVDGKLMIAPCDCCVPRPRLDAPVPTEPGYYWAKRSDGVWLLVFTFGRGNICEARSRNGEVQWFRADEFSRWSARLTEPEVTP